MRKIQNDLFEAICSKENLILAWRRVENSFHHGEVWFDELELAAYRFNLVSNIEKLSARLNNGEFKTKPIKPAPFPKAKKITMDGDGKRSEELRVRQSFCIGIEDQIVWVAVYGILGPYFEEDMPAWSYGNRLFLNSWKVGKNKWINGRYRTTSKNFYRKWNQGWPLYRRMLGVCIKKMAYPGKPNEEILDDDQQDAMAENEAQILEAFKLPYLEKNYFEAGAAYPTLYYMSLDLEKFYPSVSMCYIRKKLKDTFGNYSANAETNRKLSALLDAITNFKVDYDVGLSEEDLKDMELNTAEHEFNGLPTGLIVAGALANLYLYDLDQEVKRRLALCKPHDILHFRYVDDHLFLSPNEHKLKEWIDWYIEELHQLGLKENEDKTNTEPIAIQANYPTPLLTQTLHKISDIAGMSLDLLNATEFDMVFRDLQMLLVSDFSEEEIKKGTRTSFACTMLSRMVSDVEVDYDLIHLLRKKWLDEIRRNYQEKDEGKYQMLRELVFSTDKKYSDEIQIGRVPPQKVSGVVSEEENLLYGKLLKAIKESKKQKENLEKKIYQLLLFSLGETPENPKMWLRVLDFCIFHAPENILNLYGLLKDDLKNKEFHPLGYEYIVSAMDVHLALRVMKVISRYKKDSYQNPFAKEIDQRLLEVYEKLQGSDYYKGSNSYLHQDASFLEDRVRRVLIHAKEEDADSNVRYLEAVTYHGMKLDAAFWLLWTIDRFNKNSPSPNMFLPDFLQNDLLKANMDSSYMNQLLFTCIGRVPFEKIASWKFNKLKLTKLQKENLQFSLFGHDYVKNMAKTLKLKEIETENSSYISLLGWMRKVKEMEDKESDILENALCSEYVSTKIMTALVKYFKDHIEKQEQITLHPACIFLRKDICLKDKKWINWLSDDKKIKIKCKKLPLDDSMYRYPSNESVGYSSMIGAIYGLGIIFLQLLTKRYTLPWVFNRPEYGYEWQSVLYRLLENGKVSSMNYQIVSACLSLEGRESIKLKKLLGDAFIDNPNKKELCIGNIDCLYDVLKDSLEDLKQNQISVANQDIRQLIMIKLT